MCDAVTATAMGIGLLGKALEVKGNLDASGYEAAVAEQNQELAELAAKDAEARGAVAAGERREDGTRTIAEQRAAMAANGVELTSGSAMDTLLGTRALSELDAEREENNASREAWGYRVQAGNYGAQAKYARRRGKQALAGGVLSGIGSFAGAFTPGRK